MSLFWKSHRKHVVPAPHRKKSRKNGSRFHILPPRAEWNLATCCRCRYADPRRPHLFEDSAPYDKPSVLKGTNTQVADLFEVSFTGGASGTQLTSVTLNLDNTFFNTTDNAPGVYGYFPLTIIDHDGFQIASSSVVNGGTQLSLTFSGFQANDKLVFLCIHRFVRIAIELINIRQIDWAFERLQKGDVKSRFVVDMNSLSKV